MASNYWVKLYHEILDDPKMCRLTDRQYRRVIELFLLAGDYEMDGLLPGIDDIEFRLRSPEGLKEDIETLIECNILSVNELGEYFITRWLDRQNAMSNKERQARYRDSKRKELYYGNDSITKRNTDIDIDKIKMKRPPPQKVVEQTQEFLNFFMLKTKLDPPNGSMFSKKWITPLTEMLKVSDNDLEDAKRILLQAIKDSDKSKWTFDTPLGIQSKFNAAAGKQKRKGVSAGTEFNPKDMK